ncbi:MAG: hypothetical protein KGD60_08620 [Candidatus Thorarchaeota archaeon]|nr:hypothetical protein [Candidatus Thorarchaeota archaeon]
MSWVSKIINGNPDEFTHARLVKYGIGSHPGPRTSLTLSKPSIKFKADLDQEKVILRGYLKGAPAGSHKVTGMIITYSDRTSEYGQLNMPITWKKSKGKGTPVFKAKLDEVAPLDDIKALLELDDPTTFYLLTLNPRDGTKPWKIATKTSFPKGGPKEEDKEKQEKDPVFTKGALGNTPEVLEYILDALAPDLRDKIGPKTKNIMIRNNFIIEDIEIPDDPSLSFSEKRRLAKKRGKLIRSATIDGDDHTLEYDFLA